MLHAFARQFLVTTTYITSPLWAWLFERNIRHERSRMVVFFQTAPCKEVPSLQRINQTLSYAGEFGMDCLVPNLSRNGLLRCCIRVAFTSFQLIAVILTIPFDLSCTEGSYLVRL